ncbi:YTH-domain-containing protein [Hypoxylon sp. FL1857]|nr:YTH-domain-containing protein [Hypoxylon sp. FL1857]
MASTGGSDNSPSGGRGGPSIDDVNTESMLSPDLQDWLKLTNWHNTDYREKKLAHFRHGDIEEGKKQGARLHAGVVKKDPDAPQSTKTLSPEDIPLRPTSLSMALFGNHATSRASRGRSVSPSRICFSERDRHRSRDCLPFYRADSDQLRTPDRSPSRYVSRPIGHPGRTRVDRAEHADRPNRDRVDDVRDLDRELASLRAPKPLTLGGKGQVRFFVMRSYSWNHVYESMDDGLWATQREQADMLSAAFASGMTVVLFFAVNKSHGYQGYAVMKCPPSRDVRRPKWWYNVRWDISEPFEVEWMNTMHVSNTHVAHIFNRFNLNLPVTRARNCQEVNDSAGRQMVSVLESRAVDDYKRAKRTGSLI